MKPLVFCGLALSIFAFAACDPKPKPRQQPAPAHGGHTPKPGDPTLNPGNDPGPDKPRNPGDDVADPKPVPGNVIPEPPKPKNPEYGIKIDGKAGYIKSPYDAQGRAIDARGLPPGTEIEDPYTPGRTLLVP